MDLSGTNCVNLSLNEVASLAKQAARGAGYSWGLAEEAGKATRWLFANGFDGAVQLVPLLDLSLSQTPSLHRPNYGISVWTADGMLCPLATGAYLLDSAHTLTQDGIEMRRVARPMLLLPFVSSAALLTEQTLTVSCEGFVAMTNGNQLSVSGTLPDNIDLVRVFVNGAVSTQQPLNKRAYVTAELLAALQQYAHNTYAPDTEQSRTLGAGAGLSDND